MVKIDSHVHIYPDKIAAKAAKGIGKFYDIQLRRYENFMNKRRVTHTIFSREAMLRFAQTGMQSESVIFEPGTICF